MPHDAEYACPMEAHPDETDPQKQGTYFSAEPGRCPLCGMTLKPLHELQWVQVRLEAKGGDVAYTCPDHPHVFSEKVAQCPRCGTDLKPFKVMYTCPNPEHADVIRTSPGNCPRCGRGLAAFRGVWLGESMADRNVPEFRGPATEAAYRCLLHPLVHSDKPGACTICSRPLESTAAAQEKEQTTAVPADAKYACSMKECWLFSTEPGECPHCGMQLKPIAEVPWAAELLDSGSRAAAEEYLCPMHPEQVRMSQSGKCPICGMQLVNAESFHLPQAAPEQIAAQMNYIMEHYLEIQRLLASDRTTDVARNALGLAGASEELAKHVRSPDVKLSPDVAEAAEKLHAAALRMTGTSLTEDRVVFVDISASVRTLVSHARPDRARWPKIYIYHCPMSKGDWLQATEDKANPYYGFKMLKCGELRGIQ
jgi:hypothetical protein